MAHTPADQTPTDQTPTDQTPAPARPAAEARHPGRRAPRARAGLGLLAAAVLVTGLAGCGVAAEPGADASGSAPDSSTSSGPASADPGQDVADTAVGTAAKTALPSVVTISATSGQGSGSGSGSILDEEGHILTNTHVVTLGGQASDAELTVRTADGTVYAATVVGTDPLSDLAVIKIDAPDLTPIQMGRSADLKVGDDAIAIGAPLGLPNTVTDGIISTLDRTIAVASSEAPRQQESEQGQGPGQGSSSGPERFRFELPGAQQNPQGEVYINVLQTDAAINPGNSGGPLVDGQGRLVGVNVAIASAGQSQGEAGNIGVGFAIPVDYAQRVAQDLIEHGEATHAVLGVSVTPEPAEVQGGDAQARTVFSDGARVREVVADSPAAQAGLREGDVITAVGERAVIDSESLTAVVREHRVGDSAEITYLRDGAEQKAQVEFQEDTSQ